MGGSDGLASFGGPDFFFDAEIGAYDKGSILLGTVV